MKPLVHGRWLLPALLLLTLSLVVGHRFMPLRQLVLLPTAEDVRFIYDDTDAGGGNRVEWVDYDNNHFRCTRGSDKPSLYCGLNLSLSKDEVHGVDLSGFEQLRIDLELDTTAPLIALFMRNFNSAYSTAGSSESAQYINFHLEPDDYAPSVVVRFDEFRLADWWLNGRNLPRQYRAPEFSNIILVGISLSGELPAGPHEAAVKRLVVEGPWVSAEALYLGIISAWLTGGVVFLLLQLTHHYRSASAARQQYRELYQRHRALHSEAQTLSELSRRDGLTGLLNRYGLMQAVDALDMSAEAPVSLLLLDVDHFKRINDRRGHLEGDTVLVNVAQLIASATRATDILARWGGEEFLILLPGTSGDSALKRGESIRQSIFEAACFREKSLAVTISVGVAQIRPSESLESALARADQCLYRAKGLGRNCCVFYEE